MDRTVDPSVRRSFRAMLEDRRGLLDPDRYEAVVERIARTQERLPLDERLAESVQRWYAQLPAAAAPIPEAV